MPDDANKPEQPTSDAAHTPANVAADASTRTLARRPTATTLPPEWDDTVINAAFADLVDAATRDLVDLAQERADTAVSGDSTATADQVSHRSTAPMVDHPVGDDIDTTTRGQWSFGADDDDLATSLSGEGSGQSAQEKAADRIRRQRPLLTEECEDARSKLLALAAAADGALTGYDGPFSRLQRLCLLSLEGDERLARRAAAADVVHQLPDLAPLALRFAESNGPREIEQLGLELVGLVDQRAMISGHMTLHALGTGVLLVSLAWPIIRLEPQQPGAQARDLSPAGMATLRAIPMREHVVVRQPLAHDVLQAVLAHRDGLVPLPFETCKLSISDLVLRVAAALRGQRSGGTSALEAWAKLERVMLGLGLLLAGATPDWGTLERPLPALAHDVASRQLHHTLHELHDQYSRKLQKVQRDRAEQVKNYKADSDDVNARFEAAKAALAKTGLDEKGEPLEPDDARPDVGFAHGMPSVIICPKIENAKTSKVKDAILGHEHMIDQPVPLVGVGDLVSRRCQLIAEFPFALDVIDFVLGDLVNRPAVTIRPVLLTGTPGSGKTHFARRFADMFGLHLWSVDCGGADGAVFAGTDRRWHSAEPSHPFLAMSRGRMANPLVLLDEIEKAPTRQDYGRMWDSLLPFLEPGSNKAVQDKCLQVAIDASHISYIATANRVDPLPWPLRDRFRIIEFPEPKREHLPALIPPLTAELARTRGLDPRFIVPLSADERGFVEANWRGGSVRRLSRLIEAIINARERAMPHH